MVDFIMVGNSVGYYLEFEGFYVSVVGRVR